MSNRVSLYFVLFFGLVLAFDYHLYHTINRTGLKWFFFALLIVAFCTSRKRCRC